MWCPPPMHLLFLLPCFSCPGGSPLLIGYRDENIYRISFLKLSLENKETIALLVFCSGFELLTMNIFDNDFAQKCVLATLFTTCMYLHKRGYNTRRSLVPNSTNPHVAVSKNRFLQPFWSKPYTNPMMAYSFWGLGKLQSLQSYLNQRLHLTLSFHVILHPISTSKPVDLKSLNP